MKKILFILAALVAAAPVLSAQEAKKAGLGEEIKAHFKPYGFFRSYAFVDSRATKSLAEDMFFFIPLRESLMVGKDVNAVPSFNFQAITTRLGLDVVGYQIGSTRIAGKIETDFYCLNSSGNTGTLRMRQAYINLLWDDLGARQAVDLSLKVGQTWHPMAADMPHTIALETGAPFSPFNRSAQIQFESIFSDRLTLTAAAIMQLQYRSAGPAGASNKYQRHALPEFYLGLSYKSGGFLGRVGVSLLNIAPQYGVYNPPTSTQREKVNSEGYVETVSVPVPPSPDAGKTFKDRLTSIQPFVFLQYTSGLFQIKAKSILAGAGEYMQLNSGYAVTGMDDDGISAHYTPLRQSVSFLSAQYGKKFQVLGMIGFHKNLGSFGRNILPNKVFFSGNGFSDIDWMMRVSPTVAYNLGKFQLALEYDLTGVAYGNGLDNMGLVQNVGAPVWNHRVLAMFKFTF